MKTLVGAGILLAVALPAAAAETPDPWKRVPPPPTTCYGSDGYDEKVAAADAALRRDLEQQEKTNQKLSDQVKEIDPMELASRQQQYMMDHPQEAMALMQRNAQLGQTFGNGEVDSNAELLALDRELQEIDARYQAALGVAYAPVEAKFEDLDKRAQRDLVQTEAGDFYPSWATKEWNALLLQKNAAYEKVCATWWGPSGAYQTWLKRLRENLVATIPRREEAESVGAGFMVQLVSTPAATYRPTASLSAVHAYLEGAAKVFAKRLPEPAKPATDVPAPSKE